MTSEDAEDVEKTPTRSRTRRRASEEVPLVSDTEYDITELITLSKEIADVESYMAAGAIRHANIDKSGKMTTVRFKEVCKDFESAPAFQGR